MAGRREKESGGFYWRCAVCAVLLLGAVAVKSFGGGEVYDKVLYRLGEGPELKEVVEVLGSTPADREAWRELWREAVAEPVGRVLGEG